MNELHIIDMSSLIHTGKRNLHAAIEGPVIKVNDKFDALSIPSGGISFIFNTVYSYCYKAKMIFVADRTPILKREMFPGYKANRVHEDFVERQKELAEIILTNCRFPVVCREDYEADDCIYTLIRNYSKEFDHVYIHTDDSDMYFLIDENVSILPAKSTGKTVTLENYEVQACSKHLTPYNTVMFDKVLDGDVSDCIPAMSSALKAEVMSIFNKEFYYPKMGRIDFMRTLITQAIPKALFNFNLVAPLVVPDLELPELCTPDFRKCQEWANIVGNRYFKQCVPSDPEVIALRDGFFNS